MTCIECMEELSVRNSVRRLDLLVRLEEKQKWKSFKFVDTALTVSCKPVAIYIFALCVL